MAWTKVTKQDIASTSSVSDQENKAVDVYLCISDTPTTCIAAETADDGTTHIPAMYSFNGIDTGRRVKSIETKVVPESNRQHFTVTVTYSSKFDPANSDPDPRNWPAKYAWAFDNGTERYFFDRDSTPKPCTNSAGERFEEFLEREMGSLTCVVTKNIAADAYDPDQANTYGNAVNSDTITVDGATIIAGKCKMKGLPCGPVQTQKGFSYRELSTTLQFRDSWDQVVEDRGFHEQVTIASHKKLQDIQKGNPPVKPDRPWPLNGSGLAKPNVDDTPANRTFVPYNKLPMSGFGFT
jgi:hypothetical protein